MEGEAVVPSEDPVGDTVTSPAASLDSEYLWQGLAQVTLETLASLTTP